MAIFFWDDLPMDRFWGTLPLDIHFAGFDGFDLRFFDQDGDVSSDGTEHE